MTELRESEGSVNLHIPIFSTSPSESVFGAKVDTEFNGHRGIVGVRSSVESVAGRCFFVATREHITVDETRRGGVCLSCVNDWSGDVTTKDNSRLSDLSGKRVVYDCRTRQ